MGDVVTVFEAQRANHIWSTQRGRGLASPPETTCHRLTTEISDALDGSATTSTVTDNDIGEPGQILR